MCDDARREGGNTILEDTEDRCVYDVPGLIKQEHFYQGNQLCYRGTASDGVISMECFDRESSDQTEEITKPPPTQGVAKQPPPEPTAASEKSGDQEKTEANVSVFGTDVKSGDTITAQGKPTVIFMPDGGKIDLKEGAKIKFHSEDEIEAQSGIFKFLINKLTEGKVKKIRTGDMVIGIRGTEFLVDVGANGSTTVKVIDGTVEVSSIKGEGTVQVAAGQETKTAMNGLPSKPKVFDPETLDNWWKGLPKESPPSESDFWIGLITLVVLSGGAFWVFRKIRNVLWGNETSKRIEPPVKKKRGIFSKIFIVIVVVLVIFVIMVVVFPLVS